MGRRLTVVLVAVLMALSLSAAGVLGAAIYRYRNGKQVTAVRTATTTGDDWSAPGEPFTAISGSQVSVSVPSGQKAVLVITFSTEYVCIGSGYCAVAAYVDGNRVTPQEVILEYASGTTRSSSYQWITDKLSAGTHNVVMAGSKVGTGSMQLFDRTLSVLRAKY